MKTKIVKEEPVLSYYGCKGDFGMIEGECDIEIFAEDLKKSEVGSIWSVTDQDQCPNAHRFWNVSFEVVYKNGEGVAVLYKSEEDDEELIWVDLH